MTGAVSYFKKNFWLCATLILCVAFFIAKIQFLQLPCLGDEAYPYAEVIHYIADGHFNISPGTIPADLSKGHPMIFQWCSAVWLKLFGDSAVRVFPLLISIGVLLTVFFTGKRIFSAQAGFFSALLLATRSIFFVQSTMLLPEVFLTLFVLLSLLFFIERKNVAYVVCAAIMVLIKEPAIVFIPVFGVFELMRALREKRSIGFITRRLLWAAAPGLSLVLFFLWQQARLGWFVYPDHTRLMTEGTNEFFNRLFVMYGNSVFVFYGGIFITLTVFSLSVISRIKKKLFLPDQKFALALFVAMCAAYLIFGAMNFSSPRYMLCIYPLLFLICCGLLQLVMSDKRISASFAAGLSIINFLYLLDVRNNADMDLSYLDTIETKQKAITYCRDNNLQHKKIFAPYFMSVYMTRPAAGYVEKENEFTAVTNETGREDTEYWIFPSEERYPQDESEWQLISRPLITFEKNKSKVVILKR